MKRFSTKMLGVTLLEILLVLAIAAMIIVMSVRYYQSSTASQQANSALELIQAVTAAADGLAQGTGTYSGVSDNTVAPLLPNQSKNLPWGGEITISDPTATSYKVSISDTPSAVCQQLYARLKANTQFQVTSTCSTTSGDFQYTYYSQPQ